MSIKELLFLGRVDVDKLRSSEQSIVETIAARVVCCNFRESERVSMPVNEFLLLCRIEGTQPLGIVRFSNFARTLRTESVSRLKLEGQAPVYLNAICGMVLIASTGLRFSSYWAAIILLGWSLFYLVGTCAVERYRHKKLSQGLFISRPKPPEIDKIDKVGLFVLNIIAILVPWFPLFPSLPANIEGFIAIGLMVGFLLLILNRDFVRLGEELARRSSRKLILSDTPPENRE